MSRASLFWLAATLGIFGATVTAGYPAWGTVTGIAFLLLAGAIVAGAMAAGVAPVRFEDYAVDRRGAGQKISNSLVSLSSAAILAVYAAGYHRTGSAADEIEKQTVRRKAAAPMSATVATPKAAAAEVEFPTVPVSRAPSKKDHPRPSSARVLKTAPAPTANPEVALAPPPIAITTEPVAEPGTRPVVTSPAQYKDGTYLGWGTSRHGDIQASVVIQSGQIISTAIAQCLTRYSCSWIANLPGQVLTRQSANVDYVSGATQSSNAFSDAVAAALSKASE
jgi:uncharacterized protein with FMN-binding domain